MVRYTNNGVTREISKEEFIEMFKRYRKIAILEKREQKKKDMFKKWNGGISK